MIHEVAESVEFQCKELGAIEQFHWFKNKTWTPNLVLWHLISPRPAFSRQTQLELKAGRFSQ